MILPFAQWLDRCKLSCWRDAERQGLTIEETARELRFAGWLESVANNPPRAGEGDHPQDGGGVRAVKTTSPAKPHAVAQPNWHRLGFAGIEDAEGRN